MSSTKPPPTGISPELDAEMTLAVRVFVQALLTRNAELEARIAELGNRSWAGGVFVEN